MSILNVADNIMCGTHHEILNTYFAEYLEKPYKVYQYGWKPLVGKFCVWFPYFEYVKDGKTVPGSRTSSYHNIINEDGTEIIEYSRDKDPMVQGADDTYRIVFGARHGEKYKFLGLFKSAEVNETGYEYLYRIHKLVLTSIDASKLDENIIKNSVIEDAKQILAIPNLKETEKKVFGKVRIGQSIFRDNMIAKYQCRCAICGLGIKNLLVASHIKEWFESEDTEKVDPENGLLLCAMHDALFDKHLITFSPDGEICISKQLSKEEYQPCNLNENMSISISPDMQKYMAFHREKFIKQEADFQK